MNLLKWTVSLILVAAVCAGTIYLKEVTTTDPPQRLVTQTRASSAMTLDYIDSRDLDNFAEYPGGSQLSMTRLSDDLHVGSATERFPRPSLSLIKLFIADYVLREGIPVDRTKALEMIKTSDDELAKELFEKYPDAIPDTARRYGLWSTKAGEKWGVSVTSTYDVVKYVRIKLETDPDSPILEAMRHSNTVAADGYEQDFGTAVLPGTEGSKWGWSNDRKLHSSVSFGDDYVVAAAVMGSADDLTTLVEHRVGPYLAGGQSATASMPDLARG